MLNNQEWVDSLKEGDSVAIDVGGYRTTDYRITKIIKITPTRIIKTESGHTFKSDGRERGKTSSWDRATHLEPVTPKIEEMVEMEELLSQIRNAKFDELPLDTLRKIGELLK